MFFAPGYAKIAKKDFIQKKQLFQTKKPDIIWRICQENIDHLKRRKNDVYTNFLFFNDFYIRSCWNIC